MRSLGMFIILYLSWVGFPSKKESQNLHPVVRSPWFSLQVCVPFRSELFLSHGSDFPAKREAFVDHLLRAYQLGTFVISHHRLPNQLCTSLMGRKKGSFLAIPRATVR